MTRWKSKQKPGSRYPSNTLLSLSHPLASVLGHNSQKVSRLRIMNAAYPRTSAVIKTLMRTVLLLGLSIYLGFVIRGLYMQSISKLNEHSRLMTEGSSN